MPLRGSNKLETPLNPSCSLGGDSERFHTRIKERSERCAIRGRTGGCYKDLSAGRSVEEIHRLIQIQRFELVAEGDLERRRAGLCGEGRVACKLCGGRAVFTSLTFKSA